jgi:hypothetical protein
MTLFSRHVPPPVESQTDVLVRSRAERELAVTQWLLLSAPDAEAARREWSRTGIALLRCGVLLAGVRLSAALVHAACGSSVEQQVDRFLAEALHGGPVFIDSVSQRYYILVPRNTAERREWRDRPRDAHAECLGLGSYVGVPAVIEPGPGTWRSRWCVSMDGPGDLCSPEAVSQLVTYGRYRLAEAEAKTGV